MSPLTSGSPTRRVGSALQLTPLWEHAVRNQSLPGDIRVVEIFNELGERLRDPEWQVRQHAMRVLTDIIPIMDGSLDHFMSTLLNNIVTNLGHQAPAVRKAALDTLRVYLSHSLDADNILQDIADRGLESPSEENVQGNIAVGIILALPSLILPEANSNVFNFDVVRRIVEALAKKLVQVTFQEVALRTLVKIRSVIGPGNFDKLLDETQPHCRQDFDLLCQVYNINIGHSNKKNGLKKANSIDYINTRNKMSTQWQSFQLTERPHSFDETQVIDSGDGIVKWNDNSQNSLDTSWKYDNNSNIFEPIDDDLVNDSIKVLEMQDRNEKYEEFLRKSPDSSPWKTGNQAFTDFSNLPPFTGDIKILELTNEDGKWDSIFQKTEDSWKQENTQLINSDETPPMSDFRILEIQNGNEKWEGFLKKSFDNPWTREENMENTITDPIALPLELYNCDLETDNNLKNMNQNSWDSENSDTEQISDTEQKDDNLALVPYNKDVDEANRNQKLLKLKSTSSSWSSDSDSNKKGIITVDPPEAYEDELPNGKVILTTELQLNEDTSLTMTVLEEEDNNSNNNSIHEESLDSDDDLENKNGVMKVFPNNSVDDEYEPFRRTPRRVRFGGEHVKLRTPDSDAIHQSDDIHSGNDDDTIIEITVKEDNNVVKKNTVILKSQIPVPVQPATKRPLMDSPPLSKRFNNYEDLENMPAIESILETSYTTNDPEFNVPHKRTLYQTGADETGVRRNKSNKKNSKKRSRGIQKAKQKVSPRKQRRADDVFSPIPIHEEIEVLHNLQNIRSPSKTNPENENTFEQNSDAPIDVRFNTDKYVVADENTSQCLVPVNKIQPKRFVSVDETQNYNTTGDLVKTKRFVSLEETKKEFKNFLPFDDVSTTLIADINNSTKNFASVDDDDKGFAIKNKNKLKRFMSLENNYKIENIEEQPKRFVSLEKFTDDNFTEDQNKYKQNTITANYCLVQNNSFDSMHSAEMSEYPNRRMLENTDVPEMPAIQIIGSDETTSNCEYESIKQKRSLYKSESKRLVREDSFDSLNTNSTPEETCGQQCPNVEETPEEQTQDYTTNTSPRVLYDNSKRSTVAKHENKKGKENIKDTKKKPRAIQEVQTKKKPKPRGKSENNKITCMVGSDAKKIQIVKHESFDSSTTASTNETPAVQVLANDKCKPKVEKKVLRNTSRAKTESRRQNAVQDDSFESTNSTNSTESTETSSVLADKNDEPAAFDDGASFVSSSGSEYLNEKSWEDLKIVDPGVLEDLHNKDDWRCRQRGRDGLVSALRTNEILLKAETRSSSLLHELLTGENHPRVRAATEDALRLIVMGFSPDTLRARLTQLTAGFARLGGAAALRLTTQLMQRLTPAAVAEQLVSAHLFTTRGSKVREGALQILMHCILKFPSTEFNVATLAGRVGSAAADRKRRVRRAALETLAVIAHIAPTVDVVLDAVAQSAAPDDVEPLLKAVRSRLSRRQLPTVTDDGTVMYAVTATMDDTPSADVAWVAAGTGSLSADVGRESMWRRNYPGCGSSDQARNLWSDRRSLDNSNWTLVPMENVHLPPPPPPGWALDQPSTGSNMMRPIYVDHDGIPLEESQQPMMLEQESELADYGFPRSPRFVRRQQPSGIPVPVNRRSRSRRARRSHSTALNKNGNQYLTVADDPSKQDPSNGSDGSDGYHSQDIPEGHTGRSKSLASLFSNKAFMSKSKSSGLGASISEQASLQDNRPQSRLSTHMPEEQPEEEQVILERRYVDDGSGNMQPILVKKRLTSALRSVKLANLLRGQQRSVTPSGDFYSEIADSPRTSGLRRVKSLMKVGGLMRTESGEIVDTDEMAYPPMAPQLLRDKIYGKMSPVARFMMGRRRSDGSFVESSMVPEFYQEQPRFSRFAKKVRPMSKLSSLFKGFHGSSSLTSTDSVGYDIVENPEVPINHPARFTKRLKPLVKILKLGNSFRGSSAEREVEPSEYFVEDEEVLPSGKTRRLIKPFRSKASAIRRLSGMFGSREQIVHEEHPEELIFEEESESDLEQQLMYGKTMKNKLGTVIRLGSRLRNGSVATDDLYPGEKVMMIDVGTCTSDPMSPKSKLVTLVKVGSLLKNKETEIKIVSPHNSPIKVAVPMRGDTMITVNRPVTIEDAFNIGSRGSPRSQRKQSARPDAAPKLASIENVTSLFKGSSNPIVSKKVDSPKNKRIESIIGKRTEISSKKEVPSKASIITKKAEPVSKKFDSMVEKGVLPKKPESVLQRAAPPKKDIIIEKTAPKKFETPSKRLEPVIEKVSPSSSKLESLVGKSTTPLKKELPSASKSSISSLKVDTMTKQPLTPSKKLVAPETPMTKLSVAKKVEPKTSNAASSALFKVGSLLFGDSSKKTPEPVATPPAGKTSKGSVVESEKGSKLGTPLFGKSSKISNADVEKGTRVATPPTSKSSKVSTSEVEKSSKTSTPLIAKSSKISDVEKPTKPATPVSIRTSKTSDVKVETPRPKTSKKSSAADAKTTPVKAKGSKISSDVEKPTKVVTIDGRSSKVSNYSDVERSSRVKTPSSSRASKLSNYSDSDRPSKFAKISRSMKLLALILIGRKLRDSTSQSNEVLSPSPELVQRKGRKIRLKTVAKVGSSFASSKKKKEPKKKYLSLATLMKVRSGLKEDKKRIDKKKEDRKKRDKEREARSSSKAKPKYSEGDGDDLETEDADDYDEDYDDDDGDSKAAGKHHKHKEVFKPFPADLPKCDFPKDVINDALNQLERDADWEVTVAAFRTLVSICRHDPDVIETQMHTVAVVVSKHIRNLRSQVARTACHTAAELFKHTKKAIEIEVEEIAAPLLQRTADTNKFLRGDSVAALEAMSENVSTPRVVAVLTSSKGAQHRNATVRCASAKLLASLIKRLGVEQAFNLPKEPRDRLVGTAANLLVDGNLEARKHAKQMIKILIDHTNFQPILEQVVSANVQRSIAKTLKQLAPE